MKFKALMILGFFAFIVGCGHTGKDFNSEYTKYIKNGETTKIELIRELGEPNRKGMTNGSEWWIYEFNSYKMGESYSKDLQVTFDDQGVVKTNNFSSNFP
jgi:hypothetical protein